MIEVTGTLAGLRWRTLPGMVAVPFVRGSPLRSWLPRIRRRLADWTAQVCRQRVPTPCRVRNLSISPENSHVFSPCQKSASEACAWVAPGGQRSGNVTMPRCPSPFGVALCGMATHSVISANSVPARFGI
jgi:hypothetical protein